MRDFQQSEFFTTVLGITGGIIIYQILFYFIKRWARKKKKNLPRLLSRHIYAPGLLLMIIVTLWITLTAFKRSIGTDYYHIADHSLLVSVIFTSGILITRFISFFSDLALSRLSAGPTQDASVRRAKTKFHLVQRVMNFLIITATAAIMLMTFESVRKVGGTILASAGVLGIIIGFAAQKSLATLFAGIQIAVAQPIRIDDVVVVENQFGIIGEITLTYVVVYTWDGRRLVLPISYFLEKGFENWTRSSPEIIAKVVVHADYSLPVDEVRKAFHRWLDESDLWDKRISAFQVTGADSRTIELRGIMSVRNSGDAWDLQCLIREKLIAFIRQKYPYALPKIRVETPKDNHPPENNPMQKKNFFNT